MRTDYNCYIGSWPFSLRKKASLDDLMCVHDRHGFETGVVGNLDSVLCNDPLEGDIALADILKHTRYGMSLTVNPMLPNIERDFIKAGELFDYNAFRIYPSVHGYGFDAPEFRNFMDIAGETGKPVLIMCSFGDARLDYLLMQRPVEMGPLKEFLGSEHKNPLVLCNIRMHEIDDAADEMRKHQNIYIDTSELKHSMFAINDLKAAGFAQRLAFGSFFPLFDFGAAYIQLEGVDEDLRREILNRDVLKEVKK
ncbi:MAG: hypothetical protein R6W99_10225 [Clostridia bacterium]